MFSVVIPAYNCEKTITTVLDSVLNQTRTDLLDEIIIVNDGSSDKTHDVIMEYIKSHVVIPVSYFKNQNHGVSYTRNFGIKQAKSDWIALLDADDIWLPDKIERQYTEIMHNPQILFLGCSFPLILGLKRKKSGLYKLNAKQLCIRSVPVTPSVVFHKQTGIDLGLFDEEMKFSEDINFFQKFLLKDSYYILAEDLVRIGINKQYHASSGASSNLKKMNEGRNRNVIELYKIGMISRFFMILMLLFNYIKLFRRTLILLLNKFFIREKIRKLND